MVMAWIPLSPYGLHVGYIRPANATFSGNTTEWIMEAPDGGIPTASLPAFYG